MLIVAEFTISTATKIPDSKEVVRLLQSTLRLLSVKCTSMHVPAANGILHAYTDLVHSISSFITVYTR